MVEAPIRLASMRALSASGPLSSSTWRLSSIRLSRIPMVDIVLDMLP